MSYIAITEKLSNFQAIENKIGKKELINRLEKLYATISLPYEFPKTLKLAMHYAHKDPEKQEDLYALIEMLMLWKTYGNNHYRDNTGLVKSKIKDDVAEFPKIIEWILKELEKYE